MVVDFTTDANYDTFEEDIHTCWARKIRNVWHNQNHLFIHPKLQKSLQTPLFKISYSKRKLGTWDKTNRTITISVHTLRNYSWEQVVNVIKHETAHQIVDELLVTDDNLPHGEAFKKACNILGLDPEQEMPSSPVNEDIPERDRIAMKIQKLLALGDSPNKNEAENAVAKAHELMLKYNISVCSSDQKRHFTVRPIGPTSGKIPSYYSPLCNILSDFYFVEPIFYSYFENKAVEIFGEPHNLDIAEYVFHFLINEANRQWKELKKSPEYKGKYSHTKVGFMMGFFYGVKEKLAASHKAAENSIPETSMLPVKKNDKILKEKFRNHYTSLKTRYSSSPTNLNGYSQGKTQGKNTAIRSAMKSSSNSTKMLN